MKRAFKSETALDSFIETTKEQLGDSIAAKQALLAGDQVEVIARIASMIVDAYIAGGKVIFLGNGGSAADAQHLACEFVSKFERERAALPAIALNVNTSIITAVGNDLGFDRIFARQVEAWAEPEDVVVGISTSGTSPNVVEALKVAGEIGAKTVAFTGSSGGKLVSMVDLCLRVPSDSTPRIQESHIAAGHIICSLVERALFERP